MRERSPAPKKQPRHAGPSYFSRFARWISWHAGRPSAFLVAALVVVVWAVTGPLFHFSDTWQLVINTGTTIVTFLMVFLIQNTQNRESQALHVKLDELIRAVSGARNSLIDLDELTDEELTPDPATLCESGKEVEERAARTEGRFGDGRNRCEKVTLIELAPQLRARFRIAS